MSEYIEREAAIKAIYDSDPNGIRRTLGFNVGQIEEALRAVPAVSVPQWISVKERLPRNYIEVIVFDAIGRGMFLGAIGYSGEWEIPGFRTCRFNITHWMPLPEPPKGENDG